MLLVRNTYGTHLTSSVDIAGVHHVPTHIHQALRLKIYVLFIIIYFPGDLENYPVGLDVFNLVLVRRVRENTGSHGVGGDSVASQGRDLGPQDAQNLLQ